MTSMRKRFASLLSTLALCWCQLAQGGEGVAVVVAPVQERAIQRTLALTGTVTAARAARLSTAVGGLVADIDVDAGSVVEKGEVLLQLDPELAELQARSAGAQVEQARTALADARRRLEEARSLAPQRSIAESVVRDLAAEVAIDEAALHQAMADAAYREGVLARHWLRAPFNGVVSTKLTEQGEWVNPGQAVLELVGIDELRLDFPVAEDYLADIRPDAVVNFRLSAYPGHTYQGRVDTVVPVTDPGVRTFLLRVLPQQSDQRLVPGMSVSAWLKLDTGRRGLVVPRDAILRYPDGRVVVWTIENRPEGPVVRENPVSTGVTFDALVEIRDGLAAGTRVVIAGNEALLDGQQVIIDAPHAGGAGDV
ncbi:MAG: efflux RND transporter periplasmic adaptor subunit [Pseudomonadales bacterium]|nr:efflux RND transporter periplasmic adaptor subunit [Pseudomonadales bacterium]MCP5189700.1 efflux RND transporter periplasmic adaptor subunit [Pseudomonadales bacterium]